jgi:tetraacyldisaccharide 4'-kinase
VIPLWKNPLWGALAFPFSLLYRAGFAIDKGITQQIHVSARVVSVGNITVGGTGKTPLTIWLAEYFRNAGTKVGILSRGYGRQGKNMTIVSDGKTIHVDASQSGDEPMLMARRLGDIPLIVGKDRAEAAQYAINEFGCQTLILDDGFQHHRLQRDLDIVTLDATNPWGNGRLLPAGPLREPLKALGRAHAIVLTRSAGVDISPIASRIWEFTNAPVLTSNHQPSDWVDVQSNTSRCLDDLRGQRILAFSGIGNPSSFRGTLESLDLNITQYSIFQDHHWYTEKDITRLMAEAEQQHVDAVVTTEKDAVRIPRLSGASIPLFFLRINFQISGGLPLLEPLLQYVIRSEV